MKTRFCLLVLFVQCFSLETYSLFESMKFDYSGTAATFAGDYPAENPVWMNDTKTQKFKSAYNIAEEWNDNSLNIRRTLENLPKGRYTAKVHTLYRMADNYVNNTSYIGGEYGGVPGTYIYAANTKTAITNVAELTTRESVNNDANSKAYNKTIFSI